MMRPLLLVVAFVLFLAVELVITHDATEDVEDYTLSLAYGGAVGPAYHQALTAAAMNIVSSKARIAAEDPDDPRLEGGDLWDEAAASLQEGRDSLFTLMFGGSQRLPQPVSNQWLDMLVYRDICVFPRDRALALMPELAGLPHVFEECGQGLHGMLVAVDDTIALLGSKRYSEAVADVVGSAGTGTTGASSQLTSAEVTAAMSAYSSVNTLFNERIFYLLQLGNRIMLNMNHERVAQYETVKIVMVVIYSSFLFLFFMFGFKPSIDSLSHTALSANAIMMLLSPELVRHSKAAQAYITRNLTRC
jgi:hypothetical protein